MAVGIMKVGYGLMGIGDDRKQAMQDMPFSVSVINEKPSMHLIGRYVWVHLSDAFTGFVERQGRYYGITEERRTQMINVRLINEANQARLGKARERRLSLRS